MTTTLVLGASRSGNSRHAEHLLRSHDKVVYVATRTAPGFGEDMDLEARIAAHQARRPEGWTTVETRDLTRALLGSRHPVLVDNMADWLSGQLDDHGLWDDPEGARGLVDGLLDEFTIAARALPHDVVIVTKDRAWHPLSTDPRERLFVELLGHTNQRLSSGCAQVHAILAGRVLDLSNAAVVGA